nr:MAG TPA: hypothetical protein [Caudoviricetes sp.]
MPVRTKERVQQWMHTHENMCKMGKNYKSGIM